MDADGVPSRRGVTRHVKRKKMNGGRAFLPKGLTARYGRECPLLSGLLPLRATQALAGVSAFASADRVLSPVSSGVSSDHMAGYVTVSVGRAAMSWGHGGTPRISTAKVKKSPGGAVTSAGTTMAAVSGRAAGQRTGAGVGTPAWAAPGSQGGRAVRPRLGSPGLGHQGAIAPSAPSRCGHQFPGPGILRPLGLGVQYDEQMVRAGG